MTKNQKLFYFLILPGLFIQSFGTLLYFVILKNGQLASLIYTLTKISIIVWPIYWIFTREKISQTKNHKKSVLLGLVSGLAIGGTILGVYILFSNYFSQFAPMILLKINNFNLTNHYTLFALFLSIIHSGIEEYYWRWFVFKGLQIKFKPLHATLIASIGFSLHHFIILSQIFPVFLTLLFGTAVGIGGFIWCQIYQKTNSLLGSWLSHMLVDLSIMAVGYLLIF